MHVLGTFPELSENQKLLAGLLVGGQILQWPSVVGGQTLEVLKA